MILASLLLGCASGEDSSVPGGRDSAADTAADTSADSAADSGATAADTGTDSGDTAEPATAYSLGLAHLVVTGTVARGELGAAMALGDLDGDGLAELAVGAPSGAGGGAVHVFAGGRSGRVTDADADARVAGLVSTELGTGLAVLDDIDGDGAPELAIGAPGHAERTGRVLIFAGPVAGPVAPSSAIATIDGLAPGDELGVELGALGDLDGDGHAELGVGAWMTDGNGVDSGALYGFALPSGAIDASGAMLSILGEAGSDWLGYAFSGGHDIDGDGFDDLLVGADGVDRDADALAGAAYFWPGPIGTVDRVRLTGERPAEFAGHAVAAGEGWAAVGAFGHGRSREGLVGIVTGRPAEGTLVAASRAVVEGSEGDLLGYALANAGDLDGDGVDDLAASARDDDTVAAEAGATYLLLAPFSGRDTVVLLGEAEGDASGYALGSGGDYDGDHVNDVAVGAWHQGGAEGGGAVYVWTGSP